MIGHNYSSFSGAMQARSLTGINQWGYYSLLGGGVLTVYWDFLSVGFEGVGSELRIPRKLLVLLFISDYVFQRRWHCVWVLVRCPGASYISPCSFLSLLYFLVVDITGLCPVFPIWAPVQRRNVISRGIVCGVGLEEREHLVLSVHTPNCCYACLGVMILGYLYDNGGQLCFIQRLFFF